MGLIDTSPEANLWGAVFEQAITDIKKGRRSQSWIESTSDNRANYNRAEAFLFGGGEHKRHREYIQDLCAFGEGYIDRKMTDGNLCHIEDILDD